MIRGEDHPERRRSRIEALVRKRHLLAVALDPLGRDSGPLGRGTGFGELIGGDVLTDDIGSRPGRAQRDTTGPGRDVEEALAGPKSESMDDAVVNRSERLRDTLVVRSAPARSGVCQACPSIARLVSSVRTFQSSGYSFRSTSLPSISTGVPCVPTTSPPMIRSTTM